MLSILRRMYDLTPNNPATIIEPVTVTCTSIDDIVPIGGEYLRHAFIVLQDADITVKDSGGATLKRGTDYFTISRATDQAYSKQYSTSIYSGLKFKVTGTYTVTSFISCGTYPRAGWFNYLLEQFLTLRDVTVVALSSAVSTLRSDLNNMISTVQSTAASLSSLLSEYSNHAADTDIHITAAERAAWNGKTNTYFVATIAERDALTGLKVGDRVVVWNDGDSKRAVYFYAGSSTWYKDSDPDWENISLAWSALSGIPANVSTVVSATGVTATATAGAVAMWGTGGKLNSVTPVDTDANQTVATIEYVKAKVTAAGGGNVSTSDTVSTDGEIVVTDGVTGKLIKKSGKKFGNASGEVPLNNSIENAGLIARSARSIFNVTTSGTSSILDLAIADMTAYGQGAHYYTIAYSDVAAPWGAVTSRAICYGDATNCKLLAYRYSSKASAVRNCLAGVWDADWTYLTDDNGRALRSTIVPVGASSFKTTALANIGVKDFNCIATTTDTPYSGFVGTIEVKWIDATTQTLRAIARTTGSLRTDEIYCTAGAWGGNGWECITNSLGLASNAGTAATFREITFENLFVSVTDRKALRARNFASVNYMNTAAGTDGDVASTIKASAGWGGTAAICGVIAGKTAFRAEVSSITTSQVKIYFTDGTNVTYDVIPPTPVNVGICRFSV